MSILVTPVKTEKAYGLTTQNTYVFEAPVSANKQQITVAIEEQYEVKIASIKTLVQNGKAVRFNRGKRRYPGTTHRQDSKKAYVTLSEGSIKIFDEETTSEAKEETK